MAGVLDTLNETDRVGFVQQFNQQFQLLDGTEVPERYSKYSFRREMVAGGVRTSSGRQWPFGYDACLCV